MIIKLNPAILIKQILIYIIFCSILFFSHATAQTILRLLPPIQELSIQKGSADNFTITVLNSGDADAEGRFEVFNMDITINGQPVVADSGYSRGCAQWIKLNTKECTIKAHEKFTLNGTLKVPRKAEGGYYAIIRGTFGSTTIPIETQKTKIKKPQIKLESQAMVVLLLTVPSSRNKPIIVPDTLFVLPNGDGNATVTSSTFNQKFNNNNGWKVVLPVRNDGNIHTRVSGKLSFWSESGTHIESAPFAAGKGYILPGKTRNFKAVGKNVLSDGYYLMRIILQTSKHSNMSKNFTFAVYNGKVYPGAMTEKLAELVSASSPGFLLRDPFMQREFTQGGYSYIGIHLKNIINDTLILLPRKMEWNLNNQGIPELSENNSAQSRSCTKWIKLLNEKLIIPPGKSKSLKLKLKSPIDVAGAYYTAIVFDKDKIQKNLPIEFLSNRTQLIALNTHRDLIYKVKIDTIIIKKEKMKKFNTYTFFPQITNIGNIHCYAKGKLSLEKEVAKNIYDPIGEEFEFGDKQTYLLPGNRRTFKIQVANLESGQYRAILVVNYTEDGQPDVKFQRMNIK